MEKWIVPFIIGAAILIALGAIGFSVAWEAAKLRRQYQPTRRPAENTDSRVHNARAA